ncbi:MAG: 30S ribosome-binding factor RbfA [Candidatus Omnitrophica bacterium]|nr:30S ribosome-binding factor RbfA [Candidatus Omnitrophota bacterium]MBU4478224.1 30S ribosome-binding factor RbfA [Candidatus Omnitrophota bacterium]MCG2703376.1 30S ribosome-binding factor RbfA [Candidatus Omnitrophota bacterium]
MSQRKDKVAEFIKQEVSKIIHDEIKDPRVGFLTITKVELTDDLRYAKIFYSILGDEEQKKAAQQGMKSAYKFIRKLLGERVKLRYTPDISFRVDNSIEYCFHMNEIFDKLEQERKQKEGATDD